MGRLFIIKNKLIDIKKENGIFRTLFIIICRLFRFLWRRSVHFLESVRPLEKGVLFIGYVEGGLGLGQALRGLIGAVKLTGSIPFAIRPFNSGLEGRHIGPFLEQYYNWNSQYKVNIIYMSADQLPIMFESLLQKRLSRSYNILRTYWELEKAPEEWRSLMFDIDEIWAPNAFVLNAFRAVFDGPITIVPPCVEIPEIVEADRARIGIADNRFYFMFSFDYFSTPFRKNPIAVLQAFQMAFPDPDINVGLVIKSTGDIDYYNSVKLEINRSAAADRRIVVIEENLDRHAMMSLMAGIDCYVSLHRSEGFGLGMAEAMMLGKAVIGTNYSGNTDFLTDATGFPVQFQLRAVRPEEYPFSNGQMWAEPDISAAANMMRYVFQNAEVREARASAGKAYVETHYCRDLVGEKAATRLMELLKGKLVKG